MPTSAPAATAVSPALGFDLDLGYGDLAWSTGGDIAVVVGAAMLQERIYRRLATSPGSLLGAPDYGGGLVGYVDQPFDLTASATIADIVRTQLVLDPAVSSVESVSVTSPQSGVIQVDTVVSVADTLAILALGASFSTAQPITGGGTAP